MIHVNMDVLIWLQYRRFNNMKELRRDGDYIVATTDDRRDFDSFRDSPFYSKCQGCPIIATPLLFKFMKFKGLPIRTITQFGNVYVTSMPMESMDFDELCEWANDEIDKATASSKYLCIYISSQMYLSYLYTYGRASYTVSKIGIS